MPEDGTPLVLLTVDDGAGRAEDLHERDHAQDNENRPNNFIAFEYLAAKISQRRTRLHGLFLQPACLLIILVKHNHYIIKNEKLKMKNYFIRNSLLHISLISTLVSLAHWHIGTLAH